MTLKCLFWRHQAFPSNSLSFRDFSQSSQHLMVHGSLLLRFKPAIFWLPALSFSHHITPCDCYRSKAVLNTFLCCFRRFIMGEINTAAGLRKVRDIVFFGLETGTVWKLATETYCSLCGVCDVFFGGFGQLDFTGLDVGQTDDDPSELEKTEY